MTIRSGQGNPKPGASATRGGRGGPIVVFEMGDRILYELDSAALADRSVVIGRDKSCDWCTAGIDNSVSSRHAEIVRRRGAVWIRDLGSRNGIFFQNERVKERRLAVGDSVLLGACKVTLDPPRAEKASAGESFHRLEQRNGPESGRVFELKGDADLVIGSDPGCDIFVPDTLVSRQHAKLTFKKDGSCWVSDLGSRNGTSVDGMAVAKGKERLLRDGNVLSAAYVEFKFVDRNAVHVNARIGAKLLVAAATVAVSVIGYSLWDLARRDAGWYLAQARSAAERWSADSGPADFAPAFDLLDEAAVARQADEHRAYLDELRSDLDSWKDTIVAWQSVRNELEDGYWGNAQLLFHRLSKWTWNVGSAHEAEREATAVQALVNEFLKARIDLRRKDWESGRELVSFRGHEALLSEALRSVPATNDAAYLVPLVGEARALRDEFRDACDTLETISNYYSGLSFDAGSRSKPNAAQTAVSGLRAMQSKDAAHEAARVAEIDSTNFPWRANASFPFYAPVVADRIREALGPLLALANAERKFGKNVSSVAAGEWNDIRDLKLAESDLTDVRAELKHYRERLNTLNAKLCEVRDSFRSRLKELKEHGFGDFLSSPPSAFDFLEDGDFLPNVLSFVDGVPYPGDNEPAGICEYDRFVGVYRLGKFVSAVAKPKNIDAEAVKAAANAFVTPIDVLERKPSVTNILPKACEDLRSVREFCDWRNTDKTDGLLALVLDDSFGANRCREAFERADAITNRVAVWCAGDLARACKANGSKRAEIFADAVALLLADPESLGNNTEMKRAETMKKRWDELQTKLKEYDDNTFETKVFKNPEDAWEKIVSCGFPVKKAPFSSAWRNLYPRRGAK